MRLVPIATTSERQRQSNPRKVYPIDSGLIAAFDRSGKSNFGHALETVVQIELERRGCERGYLRTPATSAAPALLLTLQADDAAAA